MKTYHQQLTPVVAPRSRRQELSSLLTPQEIKKLKGILGSLQWLVAQVRFDLAFHVSSLQGENPPTVGTLLRANKALTEAKKDADFELRFRSLPLQESGIMMVSDAALGNVKEDGSVTGQPDERLHSQSCYIIMMADPQLMAGGAGKFNVLDFRSHRIPRVCRSSYAAEAMGAEEGMDCAELIRGFLAEARGIDITGKDAYIQITRVPLVGVTDAKDVYDRITQDTGFGTQKSLMFTVANLRQQLRRPQTTFRWTATSNMFVDAGTKVMDAAHLKQTIAKGTWSIEYSPDFVRQVSKKAKKKLEESQKIETAELPGREPTVADSALLRYVREFGEAPGWHFTDNIGVHAAQHAMSTRSPSPRFAIQQFPLRTVVAEFKDAKGLPVWRILEERADLRDMTSHQEKLTRRAFRLISFFQAATPKPRKNVEECDSQI